MINTLTNEPGTSNLLRNIDENSRIGNQAKTESSKHTHIDHKRKSSVYIVLLSKSFYVICYFPYVYAVAFYAICPKECKVNDVLLNVTTFIMGWHGLFNAFVYVMKNKEFKKAMNAIFCPTKNPTSHKRYELKGNYVYIYNVSMHKLCIVVV